MPDAIYSYTPLLRTRTALLVWGLFMFQAVILDIMWAFAGRGVRWPEFVLGFLALQPLAVVLRTVRKLGEQEEIHQMPTAQMRRTFDAAAAFALIGFTLVFVLTYLLH